MDPSPPASLSNGRGKFQGNGGIGQGEESVALLCFGRCSATDSGSYPAVLLFNIFAFLRPAVYTALSKLWVANIDLLDGGAKPPPPPPPPPPSLYTYICAVEVLNYKGLPRASYVCDLPIRSLSSRPL